MAPARNKGRTFRLLCALPPRDFVNHRETKWTSLCVLSSTVAKSSGVFASAPSEAGWYSMRNCALSTRIRSSRFREERQSSDRENEDNELLHKKETELIYHEFKKS